MASAISNGALIEIENAGHLTNLEAPEEFNKQVLKFLERVHIG